MKFDSVLPDDLHTGPDAARAFEAAGGDGVNLPELTHDPFLQLLLAAERTERVALMSGIVVAFARSPMTTAVSAYDLQGFSGGRFALGLGSQIKAHVERRFSMPWSAPAARMREYVLALRAIWDCWEQGTKPEFRGEFYQYTLTSPFFTPKPHGFGPPPVYIAGVGERMTQVAGEVGDGFLVHPFTTERYLREVTLPALEAARASTGRTLEGFEVVAAPMLAFGDTDERIEIERARLRERISFYGSTPAYRPVLELHGWGDLQTELNVMSKRGEWAAMAELITDDMIAAFAVVGRTEDAGRELQRRYGDVVTRAGFGVSDHGGIDAIVRFMAAARTTG